MSTHPFDPQQPSPPSAYVPPSGYSDAAGGVPPQYSAPAGYSAPQQPQSPPQYPPVYGQDPYGQNPYGGQPQQNSNGSTYATLSIVLAAIGFFFFGLVLGPVAIFLASKAENLGTDAKVGKILGWITTVISALFGMFWLIINIAGSRY